MKIFAGFIGFFILGIVAVIMFDTPNVTATYEGRIIGGQPVASIQYHDGSPGQLTNRPYNLTAMIEINGRQTEVRLEDKAHFDHLKAYTGQKVQIEYVELSSGLGSLYRLTPAFKKALLAPSTN